MIPSFLFALAGGMMLVLATGRPAEIAWKFVRLCGFLTLGLLTLATTMIFMTTAFTPDAMRIRTLAAGGFAALCAAALAMFAPLAARFSATTRWLCATGGCVALSASTVSLIFTQEPENVSGWGYVLLGTGNLTASLLLGAITMAWLLGHAYLTATKMTIAPLRHFSRMLTWAVALRVVFVIVSLILAARSVPEPGIGAMLSNAWLVGSLRVALGLVAAAVFAYMVYDCVQRRSTQSATGILYFGSLFVYIGELAAQFLTRELSWPF